MKQVATFRNCALIPLAPPAVRQNRISGLGRVTVGDAARQCFGFPESASIPAGGRVVLFTGHGASDGTRFYMRSGRAVWNNNGDVAVLFDANGQEVSRYGY